jgi:alpha-D-ribose 1-methylphosphonate 5-triphosphate synthase subunit PhnH
MGISTYTFTEAQTRETFLALMWAFSYPGRPRMLPTGAAFTAIGDALLDLETNYFTPDPELHRMLARTGARSLSPYQAAYHFYPVMKESTLNYVKGASVGTMLYPDQAATLIIGCMLGSGARLRMTGSSIKESVTLAVEGIPPEFWALRDRVSRFPLGWDIYLLDGDQMVGIPRSVRVEMN